MAIRGGERLGVRKRLFDVHEYHRMGEVGVLHEDDHVELLVGRLYNSKTGEERLFDAREYHALIQAGIIREGARVELIEGEILEMSAMGSRHAACISRLTIVLVERLGRTVVVRVQNPVRLESGSEPEPDIALLKPRDDFYASGHPTPEDVLLVIEVSDTPLRQDRETKLVLYARAGIREVWVANLQDALVEAHSRPEDGIFKETVRAKRGETARSRTVPSLITVEDILG